MLEFYNFYKDYLYDLYDIPSWLFYESLYNSCESYRFYPGQQKEKDDYDLTKLIVKKYADKIKLDGDESGCSTINMFVGLCKNKQYDLVKFYISKIEDHNEKYETGKLNENQHRISYPWSGFAGAFEGGHLEIIELLKEYYEIDWESALRGACRGGHIDLIKLCLESDAKTEYGSKLVSTCESGNIDAVKYVLSIDDSENAFAFNGMLVACEIGNFEIAELMYSIYEKNKEENKPIKNRTFCNMNLKETFRTSWMIYNRIDGIGVGYIYAMVYLYCAHLFTISLRFFPINVLYCILFLYKDYHNEITTGLVNIWNLRLRLPIYKSD